MDVIEYNSTFHLKTLTNRYTAFAKSAMVAPNKSRALTLSVRLLKWVTSLLHHALSSISLTASVDGLDRYLQRAASATHTDRPM